MTASIVNGLAVIDNQPTLAPITTPTGKPVYWQQTRTLTLADGSVVYGCVHCEHTTGRPGQVRSHLKTHGPSTPPARTPRTRYADMTLAELTDRLRHLERVETDRDTWKRRAQTAERRLAALRRALAPDEDT